MNFIEGAYTDVGMINVPENAFYNMSNVNVTYKLGTPMKRPGYTQIGSALEDGNSITGLFNFRQSESVEKILATVNNSGDTAMQLFYSTGGTWTEIGAAETAWSGLEDAKVEMESFLSYCFFVGYDSTDDVWLPVRTLQGTTLGTTLTTDMPQAKFIKRYRDRLYLVNCYVSGTHYAYRIYFSSVPSAGSITWDTTNNFLDVDFSEALTGMGENWDRAVFFTEYSAYLYNQAQFKKSWDVGCSSHRTIKNSGAYMFWANRDGVWVSTGGRPNNIAGRVIDFIRAGNASNFFAEVVDEEYHLYVGDVTVNGISYSNCSVIFNIPTQTWRIHEYYHNKTVFARWLNSGQDYLLMGNAVGEVHRLGKYTDATLLTSAAGNDIQSWAQTGAWAAGAPADKKEFMKVMTYADRAQGVTLKARIVDANNQGVAEWRTIGELQGMIDEFQVNPESGNFLQIEISENGKLPYWSLLGMSIIINDDQMLQN